MSIIIRVAVENDLSFLLPLLTELNHGRPSATRETAQQIWQEINTQHGRTIFVAEVSGVVAGTVDCTVLPNLTWHGRAIMFIENMVVGSAHQRKGIGTKLMDAAITLARSENCYKVQVLANDLPTAHAFYESCGFRSRWKGDGYRLYLT